MYTEEVAEGLEGTCGAQLESLPWCIRRWKAIRNMKVSVRKSKWKSKKSGSVRRVYNSTGPVVLLPIKGDETKVGSTADTGTPAFKVLS
jgi:hypothetical protein